MCYLITWPLKRSGYTFRPGTTLSDNSSHNLLRGQNQARSNTNTWLNRSAILEVWPNTTYSLFELVPLILDLYLFICLFCASSLSVRPCVFMSVWAYEKDTCVARTAITCSKSHTFGLLYSYFFLLRSWKRNRENNRLATHVSVSPSVRLSVYLETFSYWMVCLLLFLWFSSSVLSRLNAVDWTGFMPKLLR